MTRAQRRSNRETMLYKGMISCCPWMERTRKWSTEGGRREADAHLEDAAGMRVSRKGRRAIWAIHRARKVKRVNWPRRMQINARGKELR